MKPIFQWVRDRLKKPDVEPNPPKVIEDGKTKGEVKPEVYEELKVEKHSHEDILSHNEKKSHEETHAQVEKSEPDHIIAHDSQEKHVHTEPVHHHETTHAEKEHSHVADVHHDSQKTEDHNHKIDGKKKLEMPHIDVKFYLLDSQDVADRIVQDFDSQHSLIFIDARPMEAKEPVYLKTSVSKLKRATEHAGSIHAYGEGWLLMVPRHVILEKRKPKIVSQ